MAGLWMAVYGCLLGAHLGWQFMPGLASDTYQYLSVAKNTLAGWPGYTSLVHFDAERSFGTLPSPLVTFPLGYPTLVALWTWLGVSPYHAMLLNNTLAIAACLFAMGYGMKRLQLDTRAIHVVLAAFAVNASLGRFSSIGLTESVFMGAITVGGLLLASTANQKHSTGRAVAAGLIIGLAYHVRYAGLFVLVGLMGVAALSWLVGRRDRFRHYAVAVLVAGPIVAAGLLRNTLLVGTWRGGNEKVVHHPLGGVVTETVRAFDSLLLGERLTRVENLAHAAIIAIALLCIGIMLRQRLGRQHTGDQASAKTASVAGQELGMIVLTYCACMFYAGLKTVISYGDRMFLPILPMLLVTLACAEMASRVRPNPAQGQGASKWLQAGFIVLCLGYVGVNASHLLAHPLDRSRTQTTHDMLLVEQRDGKTAADVVRSLVAGGKSIIASDGQMLGHMLNQPTVSMVSQEYSSKEWTQALVRETARRFKSGAVVIRRPAPKEESNIDIVPSEFVRQLAQGIHPEWLQPAYVSEGVIVYAIKP